MGKDFPYHFPPCNLGVLQFRSKFAVFNPHVCPASHKLYNVLITQLPLKMTEILLFFHSSSIKIREWYMNIRFFKDKKIDFNLETS